MELTIAEFQKLVWSHYQAHRRDLPWRTPSPSLPSTSTPSLKSQKDSSSLNPYAVLVSEMMLQQTQVPRVVTKYEQFLKAFPTVKTLASARLSDVLRQWSGLGYNRRAQYIWEAAKTLATKTEPWSYEDLIICKGIGSNTANAILAYAYNVPVYFIETNIRTVYIHHFFKNRKAVKDEEILPLLKATLKKNNPREFYWALMDYGSWLKVTNGNVAARRSQSYSVQSPFQGSVRQIRGQVLRELLNKKVTEKDLQQLIPDSRLAGVLKTLLLENLINYRDKYYYLS